MEDKSCSQALQMQNHIFLEFDFYLQLLAQLLSTQLIW